MVCACLRRYTLPNVWLPTPSRPVQMAESDSTSPKAPKADWPKVLRIPFSEYYLVNLLILATYAWLRIRHW